MTIRGLLILTAVVLACTPLWALWQGWWVSAGLEAFVQEHSAGFERSEDARLALDRFAGARAKRSLIILACINAAMMVVLIFAVVPSRRKQLSTPG